MLAAASAAKNTVKDAVTAATDNAEKIALVLTAVLGALAQVSGATDQARRNYEGLVLIAIACLFGGAWGVFWLTRNKEPVQLTRLRVTIRDARPAVRNVSIALLVVASLVFVIALARTNATDSRPVLNVTITGNGPVTIAGTATMSGIGAEGGVEVAIYDSRPAPTTSLSEGLTPAAPSDESLAATSSPAPALVYSSVTGPDVTTGMVTASFSVSVEAAPARTVTVIAWILGAQPVTVADCQSSASHKVNIPQRPIRSGTLFACAFVTVSRPSTAPRIAVTQTDRTANVTITATIDTGSLIRVRAEADNAVVGTALAAPLADGTVSVTLPIALPDEGGTLCVVAGDNEILDASMSCGDAPDRATKLTSTFSAKPKPTATPTPSTSATPSEPAAPGG